jgi:DNA-directed RNA polymerase subunit RPC12/RpoP
MDQKIFHGDLRPSDLAQSLVAEFNRGNLRAQIVGTADNLAVQIATRPGGAAGGETAITIAIQKAADGVLIQMGSQQWLGTVASLGKTTVAALVNPWTLISRLDDIAQDVENLQLTEHAWDVIDRAARAMGAGQQLSERLSRIVCEYCGTANQVGEAACLACGAPLGSTQPKTCPNCGFVLIASEIRCPNCGHAFDWAKPQAR